MAEQIRKAAARGKRINGNNLLLLITILLFIAMYAAGCVIYGAKGFTHFQTFLNLLITNAGLLCVTCGMTCVMLTGGIDISVGSHRNHNLVHRLKFLDDFVEIGLEHAIACTRIIKQQHFAALFLIAAFYSRIRIHVIIDLLL